MILITTIIIIFSISGYIQFRESKLEKKIIHLAEEHLRELYHDTEFEIELKWMPPALKSIRESDVYDVKFQNRELPRALTAADVFTNRGDFPAQFNIRVKIKLPVAATKLQKGDEFGKDELVMKLVDVTSLQQLPLMELEQNTWIARRDIQPGSMIFERDIVPGNTLLSGQQVNLIYDEGTIAIEVSCELRHPAAPGELVTLTCKDTGKRYQAILNENKTATWLKTL